MAPDMHDDRPGYIYVVTQPGKDWAVWMLMVHKWYEEL